MAACKIFRTSYGTAQQRSNTHTKALETQDREERSETAQGGQREQYTINQPQENITYVCLVLFHPCGGVLLVAHDQVHCPSKQKVSTVSYRAADSRTGPQRLRERRVACPGGRGMGSTIHNHGQHTQPQLMRYTYRELCYHYVISVRHNTTGSRNNHNKWGTTYRWRSTVAPRRAGRPAPPAVPAPPAPPSSAAASPPPPPHWPWLAQLR
jgi:hypothetical protein